jgi:hypothetical protein
MRKSAELLALHRFAQEKGITFIPFKGPVLAASAYGDISMRQFGDLDIFVRKEDFKPLYTFLKARGYRPYFPVETYLKHPRTLFELNNDLPMYHPKRRISVEFHWDFFRNLALPTEIFRPWEEVESVAINGTDFITLSHETHLLYHALHGTKHLWERMVWIVDIDRMVRSRPDTDWDALIAKADRLGARRMFLLGLHLARELLATPLPETICEAIRQARLETIARRITKLLENPYEKIDTLEKQRMLVSLRDTPLHKAHMLAQLLFKPGINERRDFILPDRWFALYYLYRPFGMVYRTVKCRIFGRCYGNDA